MVMMMIYVDDDDGEDYDGISTKSLIFSKPDFGIVVDALEAIFIYYWNQIDVNQVSFRSDSDF